MKFQDYKVGNRIIFDNGYQRDRGVVTSTSAHSLRADWEVTGMNQLVMDASVIHLEPAPQKVIPFSQYRLGDRIEFSLDFNKGVEDVGVITQLFSGRLYAKWESNNMEQCVWANEPEVIRPAQHQAFTNDAVTRRYIRVDMTGKPTSWNFPTFNPTTDSDDTLELIYCELTGKLLSVSILTGE